VKHESFPRIDDSCARGGNRAAVTLMCEVRQGTDPWTMVRLDDISQTGFRVAWLPNCKPDQPLRIRIPGLAMLTAKIVRQEGKAVGCAFTEPLHIAVFEHIASRAEAAS
jgi:hypothetical protein